MNSEKHKIKCNKFDISVTDQDSDLFVSIETDLPEGTCLDMSIYRKYFDHDGFEAMWDMDDREIRLELDSIKNTTCFSRSFSIEKLDNAGLQFFRKMEGKGKSIQQKVSDFIFIDTSLGISQGLLKLFGRKNCNLHGDFVEDAGGFKSIENTTSILIPLAQKYRDQLHNPESTLALPVNEFDMTPEQNQVANNLFQKALFSLDNGSEIIGENQLKTAIQLSKEARDITTFVLSLCCLSEYLCSVGRSPEATPYLQEIIDYQNSSLEWLSHEFENINKLINQLGGMGEL